MVKSFPRHAVIGNLFSDVESACEVLRNLCNNAIYSRDSLRAIYLFVNSMNDSELQQLNQTIDDNRYAGTTQLIDVSPTLTKLI